MAARIEVVSGPDRGWNYTVVGTEARIGRGAGNHVRLTDPAWPEGTIRVQVRQGGYLVANHLPHPVFLDGKPLPPEGVRNLHHGASLQPTAQTLLRLEIVDPPKESPAVNGVIAVSHQPRSKMWRVRRAMPTLLLIGAIAFYLSSQFAGTSAANGTVAAEGNVHKANLEAIVKNAAFARQAPLAGAARDSIGHAGVLDSAPNRRRLAHAEYRKARDLLNKLETSLPEECVERRQVAHAAGFVNSRLKATASR